jgi:hypothetical protein
VVGVEQVYVHVHRSNKSAQELYQKMGFEVMWMQLIFIVLLASFFAFFFLIAERIKKVFTILIRWSKRQALNC